MAYTLEIRSAGGTDVVPVDRALVVGRDDADIVLDDPAVSRRHAEVEASPAVLVVRDLGSRNGTFVNGEPLHGARRVVAGDVIRIGDTDLVVRSDGPGGAARQTLAPRQTVAPRRPADAPAGAGVDPPGAVVRPGGTAGPSRDGGVRPALHELAALEDAAAVIRFVPGTAGAGAARHVAADVARARARLVGFGSESWGIRPQICLVDPFRHPRDPEVLVGDGCVVDTTNDEVWMVVTAESPPEPMDRVLALLFGAAFPAAEELGPLIEGYGLHLGGSPDVDAALRATDLPALAAASGEQQAAMALSFVRHLLGRGGDTAFRTFLATARPGAVDAAAGEVYGAALAELEVEWRHRLEQGHEDVSLRTYLRLSAQFLRPHLRRQAEIVVYMLVGLAFTLAFPFATRRLFDDAIPSGELSQVLGLLGGLGAVFVVSTLADVRRAYLSAYVSGAVVRDVRLELFARMQRLDTRWYHRNPQGDVLSRLFSDVAEVEAGLSETVRDGMFQVLSLVVATGVMLALDVRLGLLVLVTMPLMAAVYRFMGDGARDRSIAVQRATSALYETAAENYDAEPVVKMFGLEQRERERFDQRSGHLFDGQRRMVLFGAMFSLSVSLIVTAVRLAVLGLGGWLIIDGRMSLGTLVAFLGIMGEVVGPVTSLTSIGQQLQAASGALVRVREVLAVRPAIDDAEGATALPPVSMGVRFDDVTFAYTPGHPVLSGVSFAIPHGTRAAFVGPSGSGKSTVLRLLMRMYDPAEGTVSIDGHDIRHVTLDSLRGQMGVVFQDSFLFDATIRDNIALGAVSAGGAAVERAADAAEVTSFLPDLPSGIDTTVGGRGGRLSGGQRQRVAIARALVRDPAVLLLDEATSALDAGSERQIAATLDRVARGRTTVAITHRLATVAGYDVIFVLVDGRIVEQGTHDQLLRGGGTYARLWAEQMGGTTAPGRFEAVPALARIPVFSGLTVDQLALVAAELHPRELARSERVRGDGRQLLVLADGRADVLRPGLGGDLVAVAELAEGDCFGVPSLWGGADDAVLEASEPLTALVLDDAALTSLAARLPAVAEALGGGPSRPAPAGGRLVGRSTLITSGPAALTPTPHEPPSRRATGRHAPPRAPGGGR